MLSLDKTNTGSEGEKKNTQTKQTRFPHFVQKNKGKQTCAQSQQSGEKQRIAAVVLHASILYPATFWTLQSAAVTLTHQRGPALTGEKGRNWRE